MPAQPTVGLVGSRNIDEGLQSSDKKTVVEFAFPANSRTPKQISIPHEGAFPNKNPVKLGDCYADSVESTHMCAPSHRRACHRCALLRRVCSFSFQPTSLSRHTCVQAHVLLPLADLDVRHLLPAVCAVSQRLRACEHLPGPRPCAHVHVQWRL